LLPSNQLFSSTLQAITDLIQTCMGFVEQISASSHRDDKLELVTTLKTVAEGKVSRFHPIPSTPIFFPSKNALCSPTHPPTHPPPSTVYPFPLPSSSLQFPAPADLRRG
jgi:hypothetical protein